LTGANDGFQSGDEVYHPTTSGRRIGEIDERWQSLDIALIKLDPSITFRNQDYFEAKQPRHLLRYSEIVQGAWYCADGMSTGAVWLQNLGVRLLEAARPIPEGSSHPVMIEFSECFINRVYGATGSTAVEGICGAALVEDDVDTGGISGFFQLANENYAFSPILDELIDRSWSVV
jgi:hypothetical protein